MVNDVGYLFMCLLALCLSLETSLLRSFAHFLVGLLVSSSLSCSGSLHIQSISPLSDTRLANIFSHSVGCPFTLLIAFFGVFNCEKVLFTCFIFSIFFCAVAITLYKDWSQKN